MESTRLDLSAQIRNAIRQHGPVTFDWFMEQALYHPELGYYASGRCAIGRAGDYFTNVSVGSLFGRSLAAQFRQMWETLGRPEPFLVVEQGAHHGDFARDVLEAVRDTYPDFFPTLRYSIIEPFPILRERQCQALSEFTEKVGWVRSLADLEPFSGVHFSNELLDAMPVRLVSRVGQGWRERRVTESGDGFDFVCSPITDSELARALETIPEGLVEPYETEVNLFVPSWVEAVAQKLMRGYLLMVDYGYSHNEYYSPDRNQGTLRCYKQHRFLGSPFVAIGDADITAHVDWTAVVLRAQQHGLHLAGFTDQHHFITGVATDLMRPEFGEGATAKDRRALQTLLHPELLGTTFQFLGLTKNVDAAVLAGFRFARDPRMALGL